MSTAAAPFPGDSDPSVAEALRRITDPTARLAEVDESRADRCVVATMSLLDRGASVDYVEPLRSRARRQFAEAAAATEQPTWRCRECDTYNGWSDEFCMVCDSKRPTGLW